MSVLAAFDCVKKSPACGVEEKERTVEVADEKKEDTKNECAVKAFLNALNIQFMDGYATHGRGESIGCNTDNGC